MTCELVAWPMMACPCCDGPAVVVLDDALRLVELCLNCGPGPAGESPLDATVRVP